MISKNTYNRIRIHNNATLDPYSQHGVTVKDQDMGERKQNPDRAIYADPDLLYTNCQPLPDQPALDVEGLEFGAVASRIHQDDILHRDIHEPVRVKDLEQQ